VIAQVVASLLMVRLTRVPFQSRFFFNYHVYHGHGGCQILFIFKSLHLFSFFLYSHSKMTGAQFVSQCVMTEIKFLLRNTFSECLMDNLTNSSHILKQKFVLFFHD
jgi:hypothetical protein